MPPEQYDGQETPRSDLYSLGATLYTMLAGRMPFEGDGMRSDKLAERYPPLPSGVPEPIRETVAACLRADPESRPESAQAVAEMLERAV
jgi:serine/threonine-protein kinase